jgi:hypothetical protein
MMRVVKLLSYPCQTNQLVSVSTIDITLCKPHVFSSFAGLSLSLKTICRRDQDYLSYQDLKSYVSSTSRNLSAPSTTLKVHTVHHHQYHATSFQACSYTTPMEYKYALLRFGLSFIVWCPSSVVTHHQLLLTVPMLKSLP